MVVSFTPPTALPAGNDRHAMRLSPTAGLNAAGTQSKPPPNDRITALGPTQPPIRRVPGFFARVE